jgi:exonuclease VII large subunit
MKRYLAAAVASAALVVGTVAYAHHSCAATYLENQSVTIEGELVQFLFRNPHSFIHVMVKGKDGTAVRYAVEWGGAGQLGGQGVTRETLKPGDFVIVTGSPGRNPDEHRVRMVALRRPKDGFGWGQRTGEVVD